MKHGESQSCLFGPVPSRRLGLSLGVDLVPLKTCTQNCLYCQLGMDAAQTLQRKIYVPTDRVLDELKRRLKEGLDADYVTISGSGEPTLHSELGTLIDKIHKMTSIPVAVITNGTLLYMPEVRQDCGRADVVMPSLDAGDEATFRKINHPHPDLVFSDFIEGHRLFRKEYAGPIWLEVFFCQGINDDIDSVDKMKSIIDQICPDRIQLNTLARPGTHPQAKPVPFEKLQEIALRLGPKTEIIADFVPREILGDEKDPAQQILETLKRRPCTLSDLCQSLNLDTENAEKTLAALESAGRIQQVKVPGKSFFCIR